MLIPPYLKKNDIIGLVCPSGYMPFEKAQRCIYTLQQWGFRVSVGKTLGHQFHYFSGTDAERLADLQHMINDKNIKAILCGRGGYGLSRIIDAIDFEPLRKYPKWIIGYSDITLLHCHLNATVKVASLHGPMAGAFNHDIESPYIQSLRETLKGESTKYNTKSHPLSRAGICVGEMVGGNLAMLAHCIGSNSMPDLRNKILFIEDVGEYTYAIDRMLQQLKRSGWFEQLAGMLVGSFSDGKDTVIPFGKSVDALIHEIVAPYTYPVGYHFPIGHSEENFALKCGVKHQLMITPEITSLIER